MVERTANRPRPSAARRRWWFAAALLLGQALYFPLNQPWGQPHSVALPVDATIPFLPIFVVPYLLYFPFYIGAMWFFFVAGDGEEAGKHFPAVAVSFLLAWAGCYACYVLFQTEVSRPALQSNGIFEGLVALVYRVDSPYNCFPSLHCTNSLICALAVARFAPRLLGYAAPIAALIMASTLFIKQHYLLDVVVGAAVAIGICQWTLRSR